MNFETYITNLSNLIFKQLGSGYVENIYHEALVRELNKTFHGVEKEKYIPVSYIDTDGIKHNLSYLRIDIFIHDTENNKVYLLELKATKNISDIEINQVNRYSDMLMKNFNINVNEAYIINFTQPSAKNIPDNISILKVL